MSCCYEFHAFELYILNNLVCDPECAFSLMRFNDQFQNNSYIEAIINHMLTKPFNRPSTID